MGEMVSSDCFDIENLSVNPNFDFTNVLKNTIDSDKCFFTCEPDSPYDASKINCFYTCADSVPTRTNNELLILSLNVQSLNSKFVELRDLVATLSMRSATPDIICLQELWQFPNDALFNITGYQPLIYKLRGGEVQGGGIGIYVRCGISYTIDAAASVFRDRLFETIVIEINGDNNQMYTIGSVYRPGTKHPHLNTADQNLQFLELYANLLEHLSLKKHPSLLCGDFNIDSLKFSACNLSTDYVNLMFSLGFLQVMSKPTRCTNSSATAIDHCVTNIHSSTHRSAIITTRVSDHFPFLYYLSSFKSMPAERVVESRNFSNKAINKFKLALEKIRWTEVLNCNDVQYAYNNFSDTFHTLYNLRFPLVKQKFNRNIHKLDPWFSSALLVSRREKIRLDKLAAKIPSDFNRSKFKIYRNIYNKTVRAAKKMYYDKELSKNQSNMKKTWQIIRSALNRKPKKTNNTVASLRISDDEIITDPKKVANYLNNFFSTAPQKIIDNITNVSNFSHKIYENGNNSNNNSNTPLFNISNNQISVGELFDTVKLLESKTSLDSDNLSMSLVKKCINEISQPLVHIFNLSFSSSIIPVQFKIAKIVPVFKSGDPCSADNYRPIALLGTFSKILEKIMCNRLLLYLETNKLITESQFGFRKGHSTIHPMIHFNNFISNAFNNKENVIAIFCDLRKAFDTVNHKILLRKLFKLGIRGIELEWFKNYLSGRKQYVWCNGHGSDLVDIILGVPQGSILGPILFLLYINDLPNCTLLKLFLFADDTTILASGRDLDALFNTVNSEFYKISCYFKENLLALHPDKTRYIVFSNSKACRSTKLEINYNENSPDSPFNPSLVRPLSRVTGESDDPAIRFLGLYIDPEFNFKYHVSTIIKKVSCALYFMRNASNILNQKALLSIYYALIHSHIIYAIQVWSACNNGLITKIFKLQKKAIRIINKLPYNEHTESYFKYCKILPLPNLIDYFKLQFMQRYVQGLLPSSFFETWTTNASRNTIRNYILRNSEDLYVPPARLAFTERHPLHLFPRLWTAFDDNDIKIIRDKNEFNAKLKLYFINKLSDTISCNRIFCPRCSLRNHLA